MDADTIEVWEKRPDSQLVQLLHEQPFSPEGDPLDTYVRAPGEVYRQISHTFYREKDGRVVCRVIMERQ